jgi:cytochrome d ubiquinol oxidase subunit II
VELDLNTVWFILVGVLFTGYGMLDGFDLGVGALHLFHNTDTQRRLSLNSIGPVWDGNEVWLVTGGGALFAAFPHVYATLFSGFYTAFYLFLTALIFRAVAIDFRSKQPMKWWRNGWDIAFSVSSVVAAILLGVTIGNVAWGIPVDAEREFAGTFIGLLNPYALLSGITTLALFMMHGAIYLHMKTEDEMQARVRTWIRPCIIFFILTYALLTLATLLYAPHATAAIQEEPILFIVVALTVLAIANIPREIHHGRDGWAFVSSCATIILVMALFSLNLYPNIIYSPAEDGANSLTVWNAASSDKTLWIMFIIALIGMPIVLAYTATIYWVFRGKVRLSETSY